MGARPPRSTGHTPSRGAKNAADPGSLAPGRVLCPNPATRRGQMTQNAPVIVFGRRPDWILPPSPVPDRIDAHRCRNRSPPRPRRSDARMHVVVGIGTEAVAEQQHLRLPRRR